MATPRTILFLCTGNACRSQMAEGLARELLPDWEVRSAGVLASGVHPLSIAAMRERGIDISGQHSKSIDQLGDIHPDVVVTLCDAANESCPHYPGMALREHWDIFDPIRAQGDEEERLQAFRDVRNEIETRIQALANRLPQVGDVPRCITH